MDDQVSSLFFSGSVSEAISVASGRKLLVVYVAGSDDDSKRLENASFGDGQVADFVRASCIALRLEHGSSDATFFSSLYPVTTVPVVAAVGMNGAKLAWIEGFVSPNELRHQLEEANTAFKAQVERQLERQAALLATTVAAMPYIMTQVAPPTATSRVPPPVARSQVPEPTRPVENSAAPSSNPLNAAPAATPSGSLSPSGNRGSEAPTTSLQSYSEPAQPSSVAAAATTEQLAPSALERSSTPSAGPAQPASASPETCGSMPEPSEPLPRPGEKSTTAPLEPAPEQPSSPPGPSALPSPASERAGPAEADVGAGLTKVEAVPSSAEADVGHCLATADVGPGPGLAKVEAVLSSAEAEVAPGVTKVEAVPSSAEADVGPGAPKVEAVPSSAEADVGPGAPKVEAVPSSAEADVDPGVKKVEAVPSSAEADVGRPCSTMVDVGRGPAAEVDVGEAKSGQSEQPVHSARAGNPPKAVGPDVAKSRPQRFEIQFRLTDGGNLRGEFSAKDRLCTVREYVDAHRFDGHGAYQMAVPFPRRTFGEEDMDKSLEDLGFGPRMAVVLLPVTGQLKKVRGARLAPDGAGSSTRPDDAPPGWTLTGTVGSLLSYVNPLSLLGGGAARSGAGDGRPAPQSWQYEADPQLEQRLRAVGGAAATPAPNSGGGMPGFLGGGMANVAAPGGRGGAPASASRRIAGNVHTFNREEDPSEAMKGSNMFWNGNSTQFGGDDGNNNGRK